MAPSATEAVQRTQPHKKCLVASSYLRRAAVGWKRSMYETVSSSPGATGTRVRISMARSAGLKAKQQFGAQEWLSHRHRHGAHLKVRRVRCSEALPQVVERLLRPRDLDIAGVISPRSRGDDECHVWEHGELNRVAGVRSGAYRALNQGKVLGRRSKHRGPRVGFGAEASTAHAETLSPR